MSRRPDGRHRLGGTGSAVASPVPDMGRAPGLMVCGTTSNAGKTTLVAGLCRLMARRGVRVAPFKAQNMALNSAVTTTGHEIGRAQYLQAQAAGVVPEVAMNPILLKPTGERSSQVVVNGRPHAVMSAAEYHEAKPELLSLVLASLTDLRNRYDMVLLEGAGSPAEINLLANDIVNLRVAHEAGLPAVVVGDIDQGGVFAALHGTVELLPPELRRLVGGFVINRFRGDPALLGDGLDELERRSGVPTLGVLPMLSDWQLDAEDSLALDVPPPAAHDAHLDVAVIRLPHISNFTDIDPLIAEPDVAVRYVRSGRELGRPDLVIIPGSKATVLDLAWLRRQGLDKAIAASEAVVVGICGGYQMLGTVIDDDVESGHGRVDGLGLLPVATDFASDKVLAQRTGVAFEERVEGYQIHHGRVAPLRGGAAGRATAGPATPWLHLRPPSTDADHAASEAEGLRAGRAFGTTLHGLFESDGFRHRFLAMVAAGQRTTFQPGPQPFTERREAAIDRLADAIDTHLDIERLLAVVADHREVAS